MKTPDEIKKGLECCSSGRTICTVECPYHADGTCNSDTYKLEKDALAYIQKLEERLKVAEIDRKELWGKVLKHGR